MGYCSIDDLLRQIDSHTLTNLTDDQKTGAVDLAVVNAAIANADAFIDSFKISDKLNEKFLKAASVDISIFYLYGRSNNMPEIRKIRYDEIVGRLNSLSEDYKEVLGMGEYGADGVLITSQESIFARKKLWKW